MADVKVSGLPADTALDDNHYVVLNDPVGPTTKRTTLATLLAWLQSKTAWIITAMYADASITPAKWTNPYKFSAYKSGGNQATVAGAATKISFQTERFDGNNNYDNVTNFRYTIPVSGYYFVNSIIQTLLGTTATDSNISIYKNGAIMRKGGNLKNGVYPQHQVVGLLQFVAGDYIEVFFVNIAANDSIESTGTPGTSSTFEAILMTQT